MHHRTTSIGHRVGAACCAMLLGFAATATAQVDVLDLGHVGAQQPATTRPNVLLIIADDLGVDRVAAYGEHPDPGHTPVLDDLAAEGVLFRNAWSNPGCSPTRATLLTGRYSFRTHIGRVINYPSTGYELEVSSPSIARALQPTELPSLDGQGLTAGWTGPLSPWRSSSNYLTAAVGKWHLATESGSGLVHPLLMDFDHYVGTMDNLPDAGGALAYFDYEKSVNGVATRSTTYATTDQVDDALDVILGTVRPWFVWLSFNAPHAPFHAPPAELHSFELPPEITGSSIPLYHKAMTEAMDTEIGRLLESIPEDVLANTYILFVGDNGTPGPASTAPFLPGHAKGTPYEGALNVPLIVVGPGVAQGAECMALVNTTDLYDTICNLADVPTGLTPDSVSLVPYFSDPGLSSARDWVYAEAFSPNGLGPYYQMTRIVRDRRFKLIRQTMANGLPVLIEQFYDLLSDPFESNDLLRLGPLTAQQQVSYDELLGVLENLQH